MPNTPLSDWQTTFFAKRVQACGAGTDGVYFREQVFGVLEVLSGALPGVEDALGEQNFRFFVRELLAVTQPRDALGTSLIVPFLEFLWRRAELDGSHDELALIRDTLETFRADSARR